MNAPTVWPSRSTAAPPSALQLWAQLPLPIWVLRPTRELVFANAAAEALRTEVGQAAGRLMQLGSLPALTLEALLRLSPPQMALWLPASRRTGWLQAMPLPELVARMTAWPADTRLLSLHLDRPELTQRARIDALSEQFRLSPAERCVLLLLADGQMPEAVARQLDITLSTARGHVRRLLLKSHAPSLAQLLRWLGSAEALPG
ncbi:helix-turn-helix transcriptional regulator [Pelomonas aquatica]|uniref:LuxR family transcriptional regulator n=1 Tax=Pelomonas aquatica TaxID=431058 RepID=A0A9X4LFQ0_9BURK|nr:helix-turn-helix transcriptional regulator [Pelomonas aquatica]MCY4755552.1 helix-turn-helix transcriptional regulator [Pelomonas aquatica]MDG0862234.1 LuxR family transcriptional regulator [Pelomonas aquatica]